MNQQQLNDPEHGEAETDIDFWWRQYTTRLNALEMAVAAEPAVQTLDDTERNNAIVARALLFEYYLSGPDTARTGTANPSGEANG